MTIKVLAERIAILNPCTSAVEGLLPCATTLAVAHAAIPESTDNPTEPPIIWDVVTSPEATPASLAGTPDVAEATIGIKVMPMPIGMRTKAGEVDYSSNSR